MRLSWTLHWAACPPRILDRRGSLWERWLAPGGHPSLLQMLIPTAVALSVLTECHCSRKEGDRQTARANGKNLVDRDSRPRQTSKRVERVLRILFAAFFLSSAFRSQATSLRWASTGRGRAKSAANRTARESELASASRAGGRGTCAH